MFRRTLCSLSGIGLLVITAAAPSAAQAQTRRAPEPPEAPRRPSPPPPPPHVPMKRDGTIDKPLFYDLGDGKLTLNHRRPSERGPMIGVSASTVPPVLRDQLELQPGFGLVVDFVTPDGPAAGAGLRKNDVIEKLDDQLLVNPQQLAVLVRTRKPGDKVTLAVIRAARRQEIEVTVGEGDVPPLDDLLAQQGGGGGVRLPFRPFPPLKGALNEVGPLMRMPGAALDLSWSDDQHQFHVTQQQGSRHLTAKDRKTGEEIFDGPIDTRAQLDTLPKSIREKVRKMESKWNLVPTTQPAPSPAPPSGA